MKQPLNQSMQPTKASNHSMLCKLIKASNQTMNLYKLKASKQPNNANKQVNNQCFAKWSKQASKQWIYIKQTSNQTRNPNNASKQPNNKHKQCKQAIKQASNQTMQPKAPKQPIKLRMKSETFSSKATLTKAGNWTF